MPMLNEFTLVVLTIRLLVAQAIPLDPSNYPSSWGVVGALVFVIVVLMAIVYQVVVKGVTSGREREKELLSWLDSHTEKTADALSSLGDKIVAGDGRVAIALETQARIVYRMLLTWEALQRARDVKSTSAKALTPDEIERVMRAAQDATKRNTE